MGRNERENRERKTNSGDYEREKRKKIVEGMREKINCQIDDRRRWARVNEKIQKNRRDDKSESLWN